MISWPCIESMSTQYILLSACQRRSVSMWRMGSQKWGFKKKGQDPYFHSGSPPVIRYGQLAHFLMVLALSIVSQAEDQILAMVTGEHSRPTLSLLYTHWSTHLFIVLTSQPQDSSSVLDLDNCAQWLTALVLFWPFADEEKALPTKWEMEQGCGWTGLCGYKMEWRGRSKAEMILGDQAVFTLRMLI